MSPQKVRPKTVAEYISAAPKHAHKKLREMRAAVRAAAPGAAENLKWNMPAYSYRRILVMFAAFKHHIAFIPTTSAMRAFAKDLEKFVTTRGTIHFPYDERLPLPLIRKITAYRVRESVEQDKKWRTPR
jgi:uncharacterized protein YdhG (YjbR/CyaY superfamily)